MLKVCFLFNQDLTHQVPHAVPYAFELSTKYPDIEVTIACSSRPVMIFVKQIETLYPKHRCQFKMLSLPWSYILKTKMSFKRPTKQKFLKSNVDFFRQFNAIVAPERNFVRLRTQFGVEKPLLVYTRHGAGDREGGFGNQFDAYKTLDLMLLPGQKYIDRLKELNLLERGKSAVVGYPKFEVVKGLNKQKKQFFQNNNPIVVYNPHFEQRVSSWGQMGLDVLEFFKKHPEWNLIFAPHVELALRKQCQDPLLAKKYNNLPNIHIDLGSSFSVDMTYMLAADIYLGDISSQVYEFLLEKRPCIFLNGHGVCWQDDPYYLHWGFGQVVNDVHQELRPALEQAFTTHKQFLKTQQDAFDYTFYTKTESTAAERGAKVIAEFLL